MPTEGAARTAASRILFIAALAVSASGILSPPMALTAGILLGLTFAHPCAKFARESARFLLQASVVALGFGMNLHEVLKAGRSGFLYTAVGIAFALLMGTVIGKLLAVRGTISYLIS